MHGKHLVLEVWFIKSAHRIARDFEDTNINLAKSPIDLALSHPRFDARICTSPNAALILEGEQRRYITLTARGDGVRRGSSAIFPCSYAVEQYELPIKMDGKIITVKKQISVPVNVGLL